MIFVDSGAWFSTVVKDDQDHARAVRWMSANREPLLTSNYVVDETLTLLRSRRQPEAALDLGRGFFRGYVAQIHHLTPDELLAAWMVFERFSDKEWSFTDCTSKVLMERLGIRQAFAFDRHFRQFGGGLEVAPSEAAEN